MNKKLLVIMLVVLLVAGISLLAFAYTTSQSAIIVIGQASMTSNSVNQGVGAQAYTLNYPYGVYTDGTKLYVADNSNNRVLIYNTIPTSNNASANVVIGQANMTGSTPNYAGVQAYTMYQPLSVYTDGTKLYVAEYGNHRVLIFNAVPTSNNASANVVVGQADMTSGFANQGTGFVTAYGLSSPRVVYTDGTKLYVSDPGNNRVLIYNTIPTSNNAAASVVVGQASMTASSANQGGTAQAYTVSGSYGVHTDGTKLYIGDTGNNRVLIYNTVPTSNNASANVVIGQASMTAASANQGGTTQAYTLSAPRSVYSDGTTLYVSDYGNNRVLIYYTIPASNNASANVAIGQANMTGGTANQGGTVAGNTIYNPSCIYARDRHLYIADNYNQRVLIHEDAHRRIMVISN
jgi:hypothetical protein